MDGHHITIDPDRDSDNFMAADLPDAILENGAVLTKAGAVVNLELDGNHGLFFMSQVGGALDTDRAAFDTRTDRDEALLNTVSLYLAEGWHLA